MSYARKKLAELINRAEKVRSNDVNNAQTSWSTLGVSGNDCTPAAPETQGEVSRRDEAEIRNA